MTDYERGYAEGYKDGLHKYMPEVSSVSIPSLDLAIAAYRQGVEGVRDDGAADWYVERVMEAAR